MANSDPQAKNDLSETKRPARKAILVLGMHRSGTSALSHLLTELGADAPANLMSPNEDNPKGYFESMPLYLLHDELLASAGSSWDDYRALPQGWAASPKADEFHQRLKEAVQAEYGRSGFFLMKDPRVCRLVPFWRDLLDDMQVEPLFIHTHRHPLEVASSLQKRNGFDPGYGYLVWLRHILDAEAGSRGQRRSFTSYDRMLADWPSEITRIAADLDISWPRHGAVPASELNMVLDPALKRNDAGARHLRGSRILPPQVRAVHDIFERWAAEGENPDDHARLDEICRAFNESTALFHTVVHAQGTSLVAERDEARQQTAQAEARGNEQQQVIEALTAEKAALVEQIGLNHDALAQSGNEIAAIRVVLQAMQDALEKAEAQRASIIQEFELAKAQIQKLQTQDA